MMGGGASAFVAAAPSEQIGLGVIGSGGRGTYVMSVFQKDAALKVKAISDVYEPNLERAIGAAKKAQGFAPTAYRNYKQLLADKDIQTVLIASPEHWHHRMVLDALAAGKDVYVEKPLCQTPQQGVELIAAERRTKQIVQVGMQRRSYDLYLEGRKIIASGQLGNVRMVRSWWLNNYLGGAKAEKLEGALDWEEWLGPLPKRALNPDIFKNWRHYADFAGGIVADQGAHVYDGIHLLMNASYPVAVTAAAGKPHRAGFDTPESVVVTAQYPEDFLGVFSINYGAMKYKSKNDQLNQFDGDAARMDIGREELNVYAQGNEDVVAVNRKSEKGFGFATDLHVANFLDCVRTRKKPTAPMVLGFQACLVVQMANISLQSGKRATWDASRNQVVL